MPVSALSSAVRHLVLLECVQYALHPELPEYAILLRSQSPGLSSSVHRFASKATDTC
jgi:hypothetical protein